MTYCGCSHDEVAHPAGGHCEVTLPPEPLEELPRYQCPCRRFHASRVTTWAANRGRPSAEAALAAVQSCTLHGSDLGKGPRSSLEAAYAATGWRRLPRGV